MGSNTRQSAAGALLGLAVVLVMAWLLYWAWFGMIDHFLSRLIAGH